VLAGHERDRLVGALAELRVELAPEGGGQEKPAPQPRPRAGGALDADEEALVRELGGALGRLAVAVAAAHPPSAPVPASATLGAVGGAEWVMRSTLLAGERERLAGLVPDFVFLVTLPYLGQAGALEAAARSRRLIEGGDGTARADGDGDER
jgi:hypothetical protein